MSLEPAELSVVATALVALLVVGMFKLYKWTKSKSPNTQLCGTIFESLSHYVAPQEALKNPQQEIHKSQRESGEDQDDRPKV